MKKKMIRLLSVFCALSVLIVAIPVTAHAETSANIATGAAADSVTVPNAEQPTTPTIVDEKTEMREENVKYFRCDDGTILAAVYDRPVHYKNGDTWEDIDNSLTATTVKNITYYTNKANNFKVRMPDALQSGAPVQVENDGYTLQWVMTDQQNSGITLPVTPPPAVVASVNDAVASAQMDTDLSVTNPSKTHLTNQRSAVTYADVYADTDLRYDVIGNTLKESIILDALPTRTSFSFHMQADGLTAVLQEDNTVQFMAADADTPVFVIDPPYMVDSNNAYSDDITVSLTAATDGWVYTLTPSREWLSDGDRAYPVTLDPTVSSGQATGESIAAEAYKYTPTTNRGSVATMRVGGISVSGSVYESQSFVKVTMPDTTDYTDLQVVSAQLTLTYYAAGNTTANNTQINMYQVTELWDETTLTWNNRPATATLISDYCIGATGSGTCVFDVTALVNGWMKGTTPNYGVAFKSATPGSANAVAWQTDDSTTSTARPTVTVSLRECTGIEDYWTYTSMAVGRGAVASVNNATGALTIVIPDCGIDGNRMPVSISHVYNSATPKEITYGGKFRLNYQMTVTASGIADYPYYFTDSDGTKHYFKLEDGKLQDEDGLGLTLTVNDAATTERYTITAKDKSTMVFNNWGDLRFIRDTNNNQIQINYANTRISEIIDGSGRVYQLAYNENGRLESITDPAGRAITYSYNAWDELNTIRYPDGNVVNTFYDIVKVKRLRGNGQTVIFEYDDSKPIRVTGMSYYETTETTYIDRYTFNYKVNATDITDIAGNKFTYQFNSYLHTVGVAGLPEAQGQSFAMGKPGGTKGQENKLLSVSNIQKSAMNKVHGHRLDTESGDYFSSSNAIIDETFGRSTPGSIKVICTEGSTSTTEPLASVWQEVSIEATGYYTFSAYVNTSGSEELDPIEVVLRPERYKDTYYSNTVPVTLGHYSEDGWQLMSTTIYCETGDTLKLIMGLLEPGTAWFDDIRLEPLTETVNSYNLLENADFQYNNDNWSMGDGNWTIYNFPLERTFRETFKAVEIDGNATAIQRYYQTVPISGKQGDVFSFGGWGKANSRYVDPDSDETNDSTFGIVLGFFTVQKDEEGVITGTTNVGGGRINFNPYYTDWQFTSGEIIAPADYDIIVYYFDYSKNINTAWFTLPYVYKENYGQTYTYDEDGNIISSVDLAEAETAYEYNEDNRLTKLTTPTGSKQEMSYDEDTGNLELIQTLDGRVYEYKYTGHGNPYSSTVYAKQNLYPLVTETPFYIQNADSGNVICSGDSQLGTVCYTEPWVRDDTEQQFILYEGSSYEANEYYIVFPGYYSLGFGLSNGDIGTSMQIQLSYSVNELFKLQRNSNGSYTILTGASNYTKCLGEQAGDTGTLITQQEPVSGDESQQWYLFNLTEDYLSPKYIESTVSYTSDGNYLASSTDELENTTTYETDAYGNTTSATAANGVKTTYGYDTHGIHNTTVTVSKDGTNAGSVSYTYVQDRLTTITAPGGTLYTLTYDQFGRSDATYVGTATDGRLLSQSTYNSIGALDTLTYGNGVIARYSYDELGRQTAFWFSDNPTEKIETAYNHRGWVGLIKDYGTNTRTRYTYDLSGRATKIVKDSNAAYDVQLPWLESSYTYEDGTNRLINNTVITRYYPIITNYVYGLSTMPDVVTQVNRGLASEIEYTFDNFARLTTRKLRQPNWTVTYSYTDVPEYYNRTSTLVESVTTPYGQTYYTYDSVGNITSETRNYDTTEYTYDTLGQLTYVSEIGDAGTLEDEGYYIYTYDANGNILTAKHETYADGVIYNNTYTYGNSTWKDLLTAYNGQTITYDAIGNPLTYRDGITFTWENGRQLATFSKGNTTASYVYNADGGRYSKTVNGVTTQFTSLNGVLYAQQTGNQVLVFLYDEAGVPYGFVYIENPQENYEYNSGTTYYYDYNLQGDIVGIINASGSYVVSYEYDPWGKPQIAHDSTAAGIGTLNPLRYRGYYYDTETGFYYLQSRYYDSTTGRFINADSLIDNRGIITQNLFQYCGNNPINNADSSGNLFGAIVGIGLLVIGMVASLSGCSSKPAATASTSSTSSKSFTSSSSTSSTTRPHIPTSQEKSYAATVYAEAGGQNKRSKQAVAHVMNNRIGTRSSWTDIESVISAECQFDGYNSPMYQAAMNYYNNGICNNSIEQAAMDECLAVVIPIYSGAEADITGGALYFHSFPNPSDWAYHNSYTQVYVSGTEKFWFYK